MRTEEDSDLFFIIKSMFMIDFLSALKPTWRYFATSTCLIQVASRELVALLLLAECSRDVSVSRFHTIFSAIMPLPENKLFKTEFVKVVKAFTMLCYIHSFFQRFFQHSIFHVVKFWNLSWCSSSCFVTTNWLDLDVFEAPYGCNHQHLSMFTILHLLFY